MIKTYDLYKTAKKTAKINNLAINENTLFDFSFLDSLKEIPAAAINAIMLDAMKTVKAYNKEQIYIDMPDQFTCFKAIVKYNVHRVFNKTGKRLYNILEAAAIDFTYAERKSIYDFQYDENTINIKGNSGNFEPITDYEI